MQWMHLQLPLFAVEVNEVVEMFSHPDPMSLR